MSASRVVTVAAPSRLHFGMFSFNDPARRQFGGVGVAIDSPGLKLRIEPSSQLETRGPLAARAELFARRWAEFREAEPPPCRIEILAAPPEHVGLGVGTQLALAVGAGLNAWRGFPAMTPTELSTCVDRGRRSAVGTYGFFHGGLIVEAGKAAGESLAPLVERIALPESWRFVLLRPGDQVGLSGDDERRAFRELPPVPADVSRRLWEIVQTDLAPAARDADCYPFGDSVYRFGLEAGLCFASRQGGAFASPRLARWVEVLRAIGVRGVGQSSWGPTLFALTPDQAAAETLLAEFQVAIAGERVEALISPVNNTGAKVVVADSFPV